MLLVSAFPPTSITLEPPLEQDPRGDALLASLRRNLGYKLAWSFPVALVVGLATAGLAPLVILLLRFRNFATGEWFQLEHVCEWMKRGYSSDPAPSRRGAVRMVINIGFALAAASFAIAIAHVSARRSPLHLWTLLPFMQASITAGAYSVVLCLGFLSLLVAVHLQRSGVRRYTARITDETVNPIVNDNSADESLTRWSIFGVVLMILGCGWGLPMMLAAGAHRRYINEVSRDVRAQIADHIDALRRLEAQAA